MDHEFGKKDSQGPFYVTKSIKTKTISDKYYKPWEQHHFRPSDQK